MPKFNEQAFTNWTKPPSETEKSKLENSEKMVREAITSDEKLKKKTTETFGQGSYANKTNVRLNSDIDINVQYQSGFYFELPEGKVRSEFGLNSPSSYSFEEFKNDVENALVAKFGRSEVIRGDKCITIKESSTRIETDVVPTWLFKRYNNQGSYVTGAKFYTDKGKGIVNYPKQHISNGKDKNADTSRRFKRLTRLHRKLRYQMINDGEPINENITSFLLECLVWNVPNYIMNDHETWTERLKESIRFLYNNTKEDKDCSEWGEVSELLYLIRPSRKWSRQDINQYMLHLWNYLKF